MNTPKSNRFIQKKAKCKSRQCLCDVQNIVLQRLVQGKGDYRVDKGISEQRYVSLKSSCTSDERHGVDSHLHVIGVTLHESSVLVVQFYLFKFQFIQSLCHIQQTIMHSTTRSEVISTIWVKTWYLKIQIKQLK